ncbi:MAG TPA: FeoA domain-containing protein [Candidatus Obscuribacterales bacterium]
MLASTGILDQTLRSRAPQTIDKFPAGCLVEIHAISGARPLCRRMESMGLLPGKQVQILRNRGRGILLKCENTRLALRLSPAFVIEAVYPDF